MFKKNFFIAFTSLTALFSGAALANAQQQTTASYCARPLTNLGLPTSGNISLVWKTRDDLTAGTVSRSWNYFVRISSCQSNHHVACTRLLDSRYITGANILDGRVNLELTIPIDELGCALASEPNLRGISIILAESGYIYNSYRVLHYIDFARLQSAPVQLESASTGAFTIDIR